MKIQCACKENRWQVFQITESKGVVDCEKCHTQVWFILENITFLV